MLGAVGMWVQSISPITFGKFVKEILLDAYDIGVGCGEMYELTCALSTTVRMVNADCDIPTEETIMVGNVSLMTIFPARKLSRLEIFPLRRLSWFEYSH